jgi:uncharacterized protein YjiS (DUF1127 family)
MAAQASLHLLGTAIAGRAPARPSRPLLHGVVLAISGWWIRHRTNTELSELDEAMLRDIGIDRPGRDARRELERQLWFLR